MADTKLSKLNPFDTMFEPKVMYDSDEEYVADELKARSKRPIENEAVVNLQKAHDRFYDKAFEENKPMRQEMIRELAGLKGNEPV